MSDVIELTDSILHLTRLSHCISVPPSISRNCKTHINFVDQLNVIFPHRDSADPPRIKCLKYRGFCIKLKDKHIHPKHKQTDFNEVPKCTKCKVDEVLRRHRDSSEQRWKRTSKCPCSLLFALLDSTVYPLQLHPYPPNRNWLPTVLFFPIVCDWAKSQGIRG